MDFKSFEEQVFFSTVRIVTSNTNGGNGSSIGTGFLYCAPLPSLKDRSVILLISNRHVLNNPSSAISLIFHKKDLAHPDRPDLGKTFSISDKNYTGVYCGHPNSDIDLACINISMITQPEHGIYFKHLNPSLLPTFNEEKLLPGNDIYFVGYPENRFDIQHNLPIMRRGHIASMPKIDFNGRSEFLIDAQVFPGSSGSPVFTAIDGQVKLLGVISQTMIKNAQLQAVPVVHTLAIQQVLPELLLEHLQAYPHLPS